MYTIYLIFCTALIKSLIATPIVIKFAVRIGAMDVPKDQRRVHKTPVPLAGGLAVYAAFITTVIEHLPFNREIIGILIGSTFIMVCGFIDDLKDLKSQTKLILQIIASIIPICFGINIKYITDPFNKATGMMDLGWLSMPFTIIWIVGVTNAFNLIDGLDGLACGIASISCISLFIVSLINKRIISALLTAALAGSTMGFLPYNFNPAMIFMGDTGAQFLGFVLAVISIEGCIKSAAAIAIAVPILALGLPIYDTLISIIRRFINNAPVMQGDAGHLHHRLIQFGLSQRQAVLIMYLISVILGLSAILAVEVSTVKSFIVLAFVVCLVFMFAGQLGLFEKKTRRGAR